MKIYYAWITAMSADYQSGIIAGLVKRGYMVCAAAKDGKVITIDNSAAVLMGLAIYREEEFEIDELHLDIVKVLHEINAFYYSIIVALSTDCIWSSANFTIKDNVPELVLGKQS